MAVGKATADDANLDIVVEFDGGHCKVFQVLDHLVTGIRYTILVISIRQLGFIAALSVSPGEHRRDHDESLLLALMVVERLSQDLDNFLSLVKVSAAHEVDNDAVGADDALAKSLRLAIRVEQLDLLVWRWHNVCVLHDKRARELMRLLASFQGCVIVSHLLKKCVTKQAVTA